MNPTTQAISIGALSCLEDTEIAIRAEPGGGYVAFLDFSDVFEPRSNSTAETFNELTRAKNETDLSFSGWVGFFGYEFLASHLGLSLQANRNLPLPDGWFGRPQTILRISPKKTLVESSLPGRANQVTNLLNKPLSLPVWSPQPSRSFDCNLGFTQYKKIFRKAREAILDGDTYQIKISQRFEAKAQISPLLAFEKLCQSNPAPEAFLLHTKKFSILSCSPETVIQRQGNQITTRPIGGTYQRSSGSSSDGSVIESFLRDPKEVAEHNMLVDLERNDLSAICRPGSVMIERFREVESYAHLHHLVSTIRGTLKNEIGLSTLISSMLPGGSITGCPKIRTMKLIDQFEPCFRGPYTGSFGTLCDNGDLRLNLIIRSMIIINEHCYTQAGGGIVVESIPEYEFNENKIKAQALLDLLS